MPRPREIAEFGCHKRPIGLIKLAQKSESKGKKRQFVGVDIDSIQAERTLRRLGLKKIPSNVSFVKGDAVREVEKFAPQSKDLIFAGNLFTGGYSNLGVLMGIYGAVEREALKFLVGAKRALKINGRVVFIQHAMDAEVFKSLGKQAGLKSHVVELTEKQAQESLAYYTRRISSENRRVKIRNHLYGSKSTISSADLKPVAIIFRE